MNFFRDHLGVEEKGGRAILKRFGFYENEVEKRQLHQLVDFCDQEFMDSAFSGIKTSDIEILAIPQPLDNNPTEATLGDMAEESPTKFESRIKGRLVHFKHNKYLYESDIIWGANVQFGSLGTIQNLGMTVKKNQHNSCTYCKGKMAMVACANEFCSMKYHFVCAVKQSCVFTMQNEKRAVFCRPCYLKQVL